MDPHQHPARQPRRRCARRVVTVASDAARLHATSITPSHDITLTEDYNRRGSMTLYGRSKLMDIMFSQELARRLAGTGVTANCCNPGFTRRTRTRVAHGGRAEQDPRHAAGRRSSTGAGIITRLATDPAFADTTGGYFSVKDAKPWTAREPGRGADVQRELWDITATLLDESSPPQPELHREASVETRVCGHSGRASSNCLVRGGHTDPGDRGTRAWLRHRH